MSLITYIALKRILLVFNVLVLLFALFCSTLHAIDPMKPIDSSSVSSHTSSMLQIEALIVNNQKKVVKISGLSFEEGDHFQNYIIKEITVSKVVLQDRQTDELKELRIGHTWQLQRDIQGESQ